MTMIKLQLANSLAQHFHSGQKYGEYDYFEYHLRGVVELLYETLDYKLYCEVHNLIGETSHKTDKLVIKLK